MLKKMLVILTVVMMLFATGGVALAEVVNDPGYLNITGQYQLDGDIDWTMYAGSNDTGGKHINIVKGEGAIDKNREVEMKLGKLSVSQEAVWQTHAAAINNLTLISATKLCFPSNVDIDTDQIYAIYLSPNNGHIASLSQSLVVTHDYDYVDTFYVGTQAKVSEGIARRYISVGGSVSKSQLVDDLNVEGQTSIKETLELYDVITTIKLQAGKWWELF